MKLSDSFVSTWAPRTLALLRIATGFLFMSHGLQKILGLPVPPRAETVLWSLSGVAGLMELVGGALIIIGLFTRPVAFLLSGEMAFAYFIAHAPQGFWPLLNRGELAALYSFVFLYFAVAGSGAWSIDNLLRRSTGGAIGVGDQQRLYGDVREPSAGATRREGLHASGD
jgi:putative oxidoreductase